MRVLAVAQFLPLGERHRERGRERLALIDLGEPARDRGVVRGGGGIGLGGEPLAIVERGRAALDQRIIGGIGDDRDISVILRRRRSEEHTSELQSLMRISYAVFCLKKKKNNQNLTTHQ